MGKRPWTRWLVDARLWVALFVVGFWPAAIFGDVVGVLLLLVVVVGGSYAANALARRRGSAASPG
jgi:hypothetical protein